MTQGITLYAQGRCAFDSETRTAYLFGTDRLYTLPFSEMQRWCNDRRGGNVINKPYPVLCYQQYRGTSDYGIESRMISEKELRALTGRYSTKEAAS